MSYLLEQRSLENPFSLNAGFSGLYNRHTSNFGVKTFYIELYNNRPTFKKELNKTQVKLDFKFLDPRRCSLLVPFKNLMKNSKCSSNQQKQYSTRKFLRYLENQIQYLTLY